MKGDKVPARGPTPARIMIVGEAPGQYEESKGSPFVGPSGELLMHCLASSGIPPEDVFFTNLCKFKPPANKLGAFFDSKGYPNATVLEGLAELKEEVARVQPNVIVPVGAFPLFFCTGRGGWSKKAHGYAGISDYRGYVLPGSSLVGGRKCLPTYHPAAALRRYSLSHIIRADLAKVLREAGNPEVVYPRKSILVDPAERDAWATWLTSAPGTLSPVCMEEGKPIQYAADAFLTADIEYIGSRLLCCGFTRHSDVAIVFSTPSRASIDFIRDILLCGLPLCLQNGMFDCSILEWHFAIPCVKHLFHDTMIAMHSAYIEFPKDLGFIGSIVVDAPPWWQHINKGFWNAVRDGKKDITEVLPYNGGDVWVTHAAMVRLLGDELKDPRVLDTYRHEMDLIHPLWKMSKRGVRVDQTKISEMETRLAHEQKVIELGLQVKYNNEVPLNVGSSKQVATFVYQTMGVPQIGRKTPKGAWKMDDITLAQLQLSCRDAAQRHAIKLVREARERKSLIAKFSKIKLDTDGRMRCHYDPAKTKTGRLSSRKFYPTGNGANLQNVPKRTEVRAVFIPDPGYVFGYADLKSAESLIVAHVTGDPEMLRLHSPEYMDGTRDGHKFVASFLLNKKVELINSDERYLGKRVRHAGNYGMSWKKLMDIVNADAHKTGVAITAAQAKLLIARYRQLHHRLPVWWQDILAELWKTHTLYTLHGNKRTFYDRPDNILPEAIAYIPQGTVARTLNKGLLSLDHHSELDAMDFQMLLQVHDAVGFQIPEVYVDDSVPIIQQMMDVPVEIRRKGVLPYLLHTPVDIKLGYNWGEFDPKKPDLNPLGLRTWNPSQPWRHQSPLTSQLVSRL